MNFETFLLILFVVVVIATAAMRRVRRVRLLREQRAELKAARERKSTGGTLQRMKSRHAFERGEITQGMTLLRKDEPDS
ncbi:hypothetical protein IT087_00495 [Candidatus Uhrbacteria bacterium]|nr:hypothetical protein [Candidatus Uhrbacteria bacterium]